jgi:hypothetical protein
LLNGGRPCGGGARSLATLVGSRARVTSRCPAGVGSDLDTAVQDSCAATSGGVAQLSVAEALGLGSELRPQRSTASCGNAARRSGEPLFTRTEEAAVQLPSPPPAARSRSTCVLISAGAAAQRTRTPSCATAPVTNALRSLHALGSSVEPTATLHPSCKSRGCAAESWCCTADLGWWTDAKVTRCPAVNDRLAKVKRASCVWPLRR